MYLILTYKGNLFSFNTVVRFYIILKHFKLKMFFDVRCKS